MVVRDYGISFSLINMIQLAFEILKCRELEMFSSSNCGSLSDYPFVLNRWILRFLGKLPS